MVFWPDGRFPINYSRLRSSNRPDPQRSPECERIHAQDSEGRRLGQVRDLAGACAPGDVPGQEMPLGRMIVRGFRRAGAIVQQIVDPAFLPRGGHPFCEDMYPGRVRARRVVHPSCRAPWSSRAFRADVCGEAGSRAPIVSIASEGEPQRTKTASNITFKMNIAARAVKCPVRIDVLGGALG